MTLRELTVMYTTVINAVLILQMLAHGIFGCCWHHDHSAKSASCSHRGVVAAKVSTSHSCRHDHSTGHRHSPESLATAQPSNEPQPVGQTPCDEGKCLFVHALIADASVNSLMSAVLDDSIVLPTLVFIVSAVSTTTSWHQRSLVLLTSGERCALLQTWLI